MSVLLLGGTIAARAAATAFELQAEQVTSSVDPVLAVEKSIKAHFGAGFRVLSQTRKGDQILAEIEHLGNRYGVVSSNLLNWQILSSTIE